MPESCAMTDAWPTDDDKCASHANSFERIESLDPSDSSAARERLTMEEGDGESLCFCVFVVFVVFIMITRTSLNQNESLAAHYMSKARLPPVEWSSYVRSVHCLSVLVCVQPSSKGVSCAACAIKNH